MASEVNFACSTCGNGLVLPLAKPDARAVCKRCGGEARLAHAPEATDPITCCAACGSEALFVQRDFNRKLGLAIVVVAALFVVRTWGLSLLLAALADWTLYRTLPRITVCYACEAIHRGIPVNPTHGPFDHEIEDEYKEPRSKRQVAAHRWRREHGG
ncbi:MAG: hypothetical protein ACE5G2_12425 [Candidatus Krumholzibacteriia bacterium]